MYYRFLIISKAVFYFLVFNGLRAEMRQDVCMFFFVISLSVFVSNLVGLFFLFIVQTFWFLCSLFRKVICFEFSLFHDFVDILFIGFGVRVFPPFLSHLSPFSFLIICKMLFYCLKIAETNREAIFDTPLLYLCDKALILIKLWWFPFSFTFEKYKNLSLFCRTLLLSIFVLAMIISELYCFIESLKNIPILSFNALKASYFWITTRLSLVYFHLFNL